MRWVRGSISDHCRDTLAVRPRRCHRAHGRVWQGGADNRRHPDDVFTAEGLICAAVAGEPGGIGHVHRAYLRWLSTQRAEAAVPNPEGWLIELPGMHNRRAPGNTCLSALASGTVGSTEHRINDSKGCGGVMCAAPCGLVGGDAFQLGCDSAALTHGHPSGWLAAGRLALIVQCCPQDTPFRR